MKPHDTSCALPRSCERISSLGNPPNNYTGGDVLTPLGIVSVYAQGKPNQFTRLDFAFNGRLYYRTWKTTFSKRGLVAKANQFAAHITGNA